MTLVVAFQNGDDFNIVADTRLTDTSLGRAMPFGDSIIKAVVIDPQTCIAFAGDAHRAGQALRELSDKRLSNDKLLQTLQHFSNPSTHPHGDQTDFLLARYGPPGQLYFIKEGQVREKRAGHLGSSSAFRQFQGYRLGELNPEPFSDHLQLWICRLPKQALTPPAGCAAPELLTALSLLIESGRHSNVGGIPTLVSTDDGSFAYGQYHRMSSSRSRSPRKLLEALMGMALPHLETLGSIFFPAFVKGKKIV